MTWPATKELTWIEWETLNEYMTAEDRQSPAQNRQQRRNQLRGT